MKRRFNPVNMEGLEAKTVCLTLDLECDYGDILAQPRYEGLNYVEHFSRFAKEREIPLTCFVQGSIFETHPDKIESLSALDVEFELHSYSHPSPRENNAELEIEKGIKAYENFFGRKPSGYRAPLGVIDEKSYSILASFGFKFDSSVFPSFRPGIFNNLDKPIEPYFATNQILEIPFSVFSKIIRIPIALSYIKLLGKPYLYLLKISSLPNLIVFDFHLHDLFPLNSSQEIPFSRFSTSHKLAFKRVYQTKQDGLSVLGEFISVLKTKGYTFSKLFDVYQVITGNRGNLCGQS